ncbi:MAG: hypothetical protein COB67_05825 [SAR324 cluster bacterium]|uniref:Haemolysin activator HlyB C-terminal domain-containing protein n=1 Tax=SAR324 cluster bacterium TaxID=2024889 RepID=A0A2A4T5L9_9DELT|nr:MAG: hypothetical protein COB67_05825 [SAR324 cluster bacterium]
MRIFRFFSLIFCFCCFSLLAFAQESKKVALPIVGVNTEMPRSQWNLDQLYERVLKKVTPFFQDLPSDVKRITITQLEGDETYFINTINYRYKLQSKILSAQGAELVECSQCNNMKIYVEQDSLILSRGIESNEQYKELGDALNIDAYVQGFFVVHEDSGSLELNLKLVSMRTGTILKALSLNSDPERKIVSPNTIASITTESVASLRFPTFDTDVPFRRILTQLGRFTADIQGIQRAIILKLHSDPAYYLDRPRYKSMLEASLLNLGAFNMIDCSHCAQTRLSVRGGKLIVQDQSLSLVEYEQLRKRLGFDGYIEGYFHVNETKQDLELSLKLIRAEDGIVLRNMTFSGQSNLDSTGGNVRMAGNGKKLNSAIAVYPAMSFKFSGPVTKDSTTKIETIDQFLGVEYRFLGNTFWEELEFGLDAGAFYGITSNQTSDLSISILSITPLIRYRAPWKLEEKYHLYAHLGMGWAIVGSSGIQNAYKYGVEFYITNSIAIGLESISIPSTDVELSTKDSQGNTLEGEFQGSGSSLTIRGYF